MALEADAPPLPPGCVVALQGLGRSELNGLRGACLRRTEELRRKGRVGVRLDDGRELSVLLANLLPAVEVREAPGKGAAVFARMRIKAGDLVVHERPALVGRLGAPPERRAFRALDPEEQRDVMALCDAYAEGPGGKTLEGIMATNGLPRGPKAEEVVLCPLASRFNHSCSPNAEYLWSEAGYVEEVRAVRDIRPGEEVSVNYFGDSIRHPTAVRRAHLRDGFRFDCCCHVCRAADPASDERRQRLVRLGEDILGCRDRPEAGVRMAEEMLELMQQEGISAPRTVAQVCNDGFELSVLVGDPSEVQYWAHMSYEAHRLGWGEDYAMTRRMKRFAQQPPELAGPQPSTAPCARRLGGADAAAADAAPLAAAATAPHQRGGREEAKQEQEQREERSRAEEASAGLGAMD